MCFVQPQLSEDYKDDANILGTSYGVRSTSHTTNDGRTLAKNCGGGGIYVTPYESKYIEGSQNPSTEGLSRIEYNLNNGENFFNLSGVDGLNMDYDLKIHNEGGISRDDLCVNLPSCGDVLGQFIEDVDCSGDGMKACVEYGPDGKVVRTRCKRGETQRAVPQSQAGETQCHLPPQWESSYDLTDIATQTWVGIWMFPFSLRPKDIRWEMMELFIAIQIRRVNVLLSEIGTLLLFYH